MGEIVILKGSVVRKRVEVPVEPPVENRIERIAQRIALVVGMIGDDRVQFVLQGFPFAVAAGGIFPAGQPGFNE